MARSPPEEPLEKAQHWLSTGWPVFLGIIALASSAGVAYNNIGRIAILETDLNLRNSVLPAAQTAERINNLERAIKDLPSNDATINERLKTIRENRTEDLERIRRLRDDLTAVQAVVSDLRAAVSRLDETARKK